VCLLHIALSEQHILKNYCLPVGVALCTVGALQYRLLCLDLMLIHTAFLCMLYYYTTQVDAASKTLQQRASTQLEHEIACLSLNPAANTAIKTSATTAEAAAASSSSSAEAGEDAMAVVEEPEVLVHQSLHTPFVSSAVCTIDRAYIMSTDYIVNKAVMSSILCTTNRVYVTSTCCCLQCYVVLIVIISLSKQLELCLQGYSREFVHASLLIDVVSCFVLTPDCVCMIVLTMYALQDAGPSVSSQLDGFIAVG
jgi:hypothetical protein